jgi:hypothetical protein
MGARCAFRPLATPAAMSAPPERAKNDHISRKYLAGDGGLKVSYNIGVEQLPPRQRGVIFYIEQHKGGLTLALSAVFYAASWAVSLLSPWHTAGALMRSVGEAALVGGLCDYIALKMIFERLVSAQLWRAAAQPAEAHQWNFIDDREPVADPENDRR